MSFLQCPCTIVIQRLQINENIANYLQNTKVKILRALQISNIHDHHRLLKKYMLVSEV